MNNWMRVNDVMQALDCSQAKAYAVMKKLNDELKAQGYITLAGRVSRTFFNERFYGPGDGKNEVQHEQRVS